MAQFWWLFSCLLLVSTTAQFVSEEELKSRQRVMDRKKPLRKFKKYIECQVCEFAAQSIYRIWLMSMNQPDFNENEMYNLVIESCNPWSNIGVWINTIDIALNGTRLELQPQDEMGQCHRECETVRSVCDEIVSAEADEIANYIWTNKHEMTTERLAGFMCKSACGEDRENAMPAVPNKVIKQFKKVDEEWTKMSKEEEENRVKIFNEIMEQKKQQMREKRDL
mmetsp:Transcript_44536/g.71315  ORF Transcript_44536/g.71315 Transcript_44536/m.71315 type:complete len:223 (-) Transcript_44536:1-669(-)